MKFAIVVNASPFSSQASQSAYGFCTAALAMGHSIERVFFYHDGVHIGSNSANPPQDEVNPGLLWQQLGISHTIPLDICVAAAIRRGISDGSDKFAANLTAGFRLVGLGQLAHACITADRLLVFGE